MAAAPSPRPRRPQPIGATMGSRPFLIGVAAMAAVVVASNILVQYPVEGRLGPIALADVLTWGAFTYPFAFLVCDLVNRRLGPETARMVVLVGFLAAVVMSMVLATPRIAIASGTAFLLAQLLNTVVFDRLRRGRWWRAPIVSSTAGSILDTALFFSLAFAASFAVLGPNDPFAIEAAPLLGVLAVETPRWVSWALGDLAVKLAAVLVLLAPYRVLMAFVLPREAVRT